MADNKITREVYRQYADKIVSVLNKEGFYEQFKNESIKARQISNSQKNASFKTSR